MQNATAVILVQAIALAVVTVLSTRGSRTSSYTANPRCPGAYTELYNQC